MWRNNLLKSKGPLPKTVARAFGSANVPSYVYSGSESAFLRSFNAYKEAQTLLQQKSVSEANRLIRVAIRNAASISGDTPAVSSYIQQLRSFQRKINDSQHAESVHGPNLTRGNHK